MLARCEYEICVNKGGRLFADVFLHHFSNGGYSFGMPEVLCWKLFSMRGFLGSRCLLELRNRKILLFMLLDQEFLNSQID